jgi:alkylhydroperoxidase family enzyme
MDESHTTKIRRLVHAVLNSPGDTNTTVRQAVEDYSGRLGGSPPSTAGDKPAELTGYVKKVALHAYKTTDEDIAGLHQAGYSEVEIFEITLSAALGAGVARWERGLAALKEDHE